LEASALGGLTAACPVWKERNKVRDRRTDRQKQRLLPLPFGWGHNKQSDDQTSGDQYDHFNNFWHSVLQ